jgi:hypothetical protein
MKNPPQSLHVKTQEHLKKHWISYVILGALGMVATDADATALARLTENGNSFKTMVTGSVGQAALLVGSIAGAFKAFMAGNIWLAVGVFMVGLLFSWHIENISSIFTAH